MITNKDGDILGFSSSPKKIKVISMRTLTLLQDYKRGDIVIALSVLWLGLCERYNVEPSYVLGIAQRIRTETFDNQQDSQFRAIKDYMEHEL